MSVASYSGFILFFSVVMFGNPFANVLPDSLVSHVQEARESSDIEELEDEYVRRYQKGEYNRALSLAKKVLEFQEAKLGSNHPSVGDTLSNVAMILTAMDRLDEAQSLLKRAIDIKERFFGAKSPETLKALERYACFLWSIKKKKEATEVEDRIDTMLYPDAKKPLGENVTKGKALRRVAPRYPDELRVARVGGTVIVRVLIDEAGNVVEASGRCGDPLLVQAAVEAARAWKFKPTLVNGSPVQVVGRIDFNFVP